MLTKNIYIFECIKKYTLTEYFIRDICMPTYSCNCPINQLCDSSVMHKIIQIQASSFS